MKFYLESIGCRLNRSEIEQLADEIHASGHRIVQHAAQADIVILNTCAVTQAAVSDSRQRCRQLAAEGADRIVLTGCWASLEPSHAANLPGILNVIPNASKDNLVHNLLSHQVIKSDLDLPKRNEFPSTIRKTRAFIKVQDGCNHHCSFCITTIARGRSQSHPIRTVLERVAAARKTGHKEVVLCGVQLGAWGHDLKPRMTLDQLLRALLAQTDIPRLRLSSLEPWALSPQLLELWQDPRLCRHLHLPLQSGSASILRRMSRRINPVRFEDRLQFVRSLVPGIAVTTDLIVGFPGEGEREFEESLAFVDRMNFSGGHVFTYSARPGTEAAKYSDQVPRPIRRERGLAMRQILKASTRSFSEARVGTISTVLWEGMATRDPSGWKLGGWSDEYLRVHAHHPIKRINTIDQVLLTAVTPEGMLGVIQE